MKFNHRQTRIEFVLAIAFVAGLVGTALTIQLGAAAGADSRPRAKAETGARAPVVCARTAD